MGCLVYNRVVDEMRSSGDVNGQPGKGWSDESSIQPDPGSLTGLYGRLSNNTPAGTRVEERDAAVESRVTRFGGSMNGQAAG
jgi:hypothetical protein